VTDGASASLMRVRPLSKTGTELPTRAHGDRRTLPMTGRLSP
jgi:hypothetical protein